MGGLVEQGRGPAQGAVMRAQDSFGERTGAAMFQIGRASERLSSGGLSRLYEARLHAACGRLVGDRIHVQTEASWPRCMASIF